MTVTDTLNLSYYWEFPSNQRLRSLYLLLISVSIVSLFLRGALTYSPHQTQNREGWGPTTSLLDEHSSLQAVENRTLGFQNVLCINLPSRTDKRDAITLGSSVTDFHVDWIEGVSAEDMDLKAYPPHYGEPGRPIMIPGEVGNWRAHLNAMRRIVSDRLTTALIIEDDSDWDVTLKIQLHEFALASQSLQKAKQVIAPKMSRHRTPNTAPNSPYGDEWDILWLGHCGMTCRQDAPYYKRSNDSTALPVDSLPPYWSGPAVHDNVDKAPNTRIICQTRYVICTGAYAVSYNAAQKIIAALSVLPSDEIFPPGTSSIFDVSLGRLCENGYLTCYASFPSLIGNWRPAGSPSRNSDIQIVQNSEGEYQEAVSSGIAQSTMLNLDKLLEGTHGTDPAIHHSVAPEANLYDKRPHLGGGLYVLDNDTMIERKV